MFVYLLAVFAMSAPAGYLAGSVYIDMNESDQDWLPYACALFPPLGALIASIAITQAHTKD